MNTKKSKNDISINDLDQFKFSTKSTPKKKMKKISLEYDSSNSKPSKTFKTTDEKPSKEKYDTRKNYEEILAILEKMRSS